MAYWIDDNWENGPMIRRAGTAAFGLYSVCGLWIARHGTDGFIPSDVAADHGTVEWARKLIDAGLWESVEGGFQDIHYLTLNPSAAQVEDRRRKEADRKARWRARAAARRNATANGQQPPLPDVHTGQDTGHHAGLPRGVPVGVPLFPTLPPSRGGEGDARAAPQRTAHPPNTTTTTTARSDDWHEDPHVIADDEEQIRLDAEQAVGAIQGQRDRARRGAEAARAAITGRT